MGKKGGGRVRVKAMGPKMPKQVNPLEALNSIAPQDMIQLPPKPDKSYCTVWPLNETFSMDYSRFSTIYPNYLDAKKTVKMGRRIAASDAVDTPTVQDIAFALQSMNIRHVLQPYKSYSRDPDSHWDNQGRVLVDLPTAKRNSDGVMEMVDGAFDISDSDGGDKENNMGTNNKRTLLREVASRIPHLPSRKLRLEQEKKAKEAAEKKAKEQEAAAKRAAAAKSVAASSQGSGKSNKKKKGKKKR